MAWPNIPHAAAFLDPLHNPSFEEAEQRRGGQKLFRPFCQLAASKMRAVGPIAWFAVKAVAGKGRGNEIPKEIPEGWTATVHDTTQTCLNIAWGGSYLT